MKKLVFRKFILNVLIFFVFSILIVGLIVWTIQAINYFDFVSEDGHGLKVYFLFTLLNFTKMIHRILPFMFFISLFYTIIRYEMNNELNIFWINGISKIKFVNTLIILSIFLMTFQIFLGSYLSPVSQLKARNLNKNSNVEYITNLINEGRFINVVQGLTIFIEKKKTDKFSNIFIDDSSKGYSRMINSKNGTLINDPNNRKFLLFDGKVINIDKDRINTFKFNQIDFNLGTFGSNSIIKPKIQEINSKILLSCFFDQIKVETKLCEENNSMNEMKQELLKRFFKPIYIPLIVLISCFLFISGKFDKNYSRLKIYIFLSVLLLIIISETSLRYSTSSNILFALYLLIPFILFLIFYLFSYFKVNNA